MAANVKNSSGEFVTPSTAGVTAAAASEASTFPADTRQAPDHQRARRRHLPHRLVHVPPRLPGPEGCDQGPGPRRPDRLDADRRPADRGGLGYAPLPAPVQQQGARVAPHHHDRRIADLALIATSLLATARTGHPAPAGWPFAHTPAGARRSDAFPAPTATIHEPRRSPTRDGLADPARLNGSRRSRLPDRLFSGGTAVIAGIVVAHPDRDLHPARGQLRADVADLRPRVHHRDTTWDPVAAVYGALPFIVGTLLSSAIAIVFAAPVGLLTAIFLAEYAPRRVSTPLTFVIELLAAIPSVVIGLWGVFILGPFLNATISRCDRRHARVDPVLQRTRVRDRPVHGGRDPLDHDPADDRHDLARGPRRRAGEPARGDVWARRDPVGGDRRASWSRSRAPGSLARSSWGSDGPSARRSP